MFGELLPSVWLRAPCISKTSRIISPSSNPPMSFILRFYNSKSHPLKVEGIRTSHLRGPALDKLSFSSRLSKSKSQLPPPLPHRFQVYRRVMTEGSKEFCPPKTAERLRHRDGLPKSYTMIYRSDFGNYLLLGQAAVFLTTGAFIICFFLRLYMESLTKEEIVELQKRKIQQMRDAQEKEKEFEFVQVLEDLRDPEDRKWVHPSLEDMFETSPAEIGFLVFTFIAFAVSLSKLLRSVPVRIYINQKNHCIAIKYGHVIPGKIVHHEFLAGTVELVEKRMTWHAGTLYRDGSGRHLFLLERFFRTPADFNKLLGHDYEFMDEAMRSRGRDRS